MTTDAPRETRLTRTLGPLTVSPVGLGGMSLTGAYGTADRD